MIFKKLLSYFKRKHLLASFTYGTVTFKVYMRNDTLKISKDGRVVILPVHEYRPQAPITPKVVGYLRQAVAQQVKHNKK